MTLKQIPRGKAGWGEEEEIYTEKSLIFDQVPLLQWVLELLEKRENTSSQSSLQNPPFWSSRAPTQKPLFLPASPQGMLKHDMQISAKTDF